VKLSIHMAVSVKITVFWCYDVFVIG
jgi:hypothetical protein